MKSTLLGLLDFEVMMSDGVANPYAALPESAFWKSAVATKPPTSIAGLWQPGFAIDASHRVVTFGSCFAQHFGRALRERGYKWYITEKPPADMDKGERQARHYNLFSCRTGNIYTTSLLHQWVMWAIGETSPPEVTWAAADGRHVDPFRPAIEPDGFATPADVFESRLVTIDAFRDAIVTTNVFVFTLGLTESWFDAALDCEYPMCPGTAAGVFDETHHKFFDQPYDFVLFHLKAAIEKIASVNGKARFLLTVSPVPLTATNSGRHVLFATMQAKAVLRAVAAQLASANPNVDYFPSYELIASPVFGRTFFEPNMRSVTAEGVGFVMQNFFAALDGIGAGDGAYIEASDTAEHAKRPRRQSKSADVVCEEELLGAFGER